MWSCTMGGADRFEGIKMTHRWSFLELHSWSFFRLHSIFQKVISARTPLSNFEQAKYFLKSLPIFTLSEVPGPQ